MLLVNLLNTTRKDTFFSTNSQAFLHFFIPFYFKAKVLDSHLSEEINHTVQQAIDNESIVFTDKSTSYVDIAGFVELHITEKSDRQTTKETLRWVHITISNAKRNLLGNYHKIKRKYLQLYLNEFVYKLNRRYFGDRIFDRLVIANITGL